MREGGPFLCRPRCQRSTTLLWPQLFSKWQTAWQSQVVGNLSRRPLKQVAPGPSLQADGRQTSDKQLFVLGHVLHSSSHHSVLTSVTGQLCSQPTVPVRSLYFPFRWGRLGVSAECLWSACLLTQFHVVKLLNFCPLTLWLLLLGTIHQVLKIWQAEESIFLCVTHLHNGPLECSLRCF